MDFKSFMRKLDGDNNEKAFDSTAETAGAFDVQSVIRIARSDGYKLLGLETRPEYPIGVLEAFRDGVNGTEMGLYCDNSLSYRYECSLRLIYVSGKRYAQQSQRDSQGSVQERLPTPPSVPNAGPEGSPTRGGAFRLEIQRARAAVDTANARLGDQTLNTLSREEPSGRYGGTNIFPPVYPTRGIRTASSAEESRVPSVRDEWTYTERSSEDTGEPW
jgi:hypothetical protein